MKLKEKLLTSVIGLSTLCLITCPITSNAALQANGNEGTTATIDSWLENIRNMEATGGTLGLKDTINTTDLTSSAEKSNDLDIHMQKNTEYGAMAILSASAYGNQNPIPDGGTTTGNKSGVVINLNKELVSAGTISDLTMYTNANGKYKNLYTTSYAAKIGDAIAETSGWHTTNNISKWINNQRVNVLIRAYAESLFSYYGDNYYNYGGGDAYYKNPWHSRAVIVVGEGF